MRPCEKDISTTISRRTGNSATPVIAGRANRELHRVVREQRRRAERYLRFLCDDVEALGVSRDHQDSLLQACFTRNSQAAEAATREALWWNLGRLASLLDTKSGANAAG